MKIKTVLRIQKYQRNIMMIIVNITNQYAYVLILIYHFLEVRIPNDAAEENDEDMDLLVNLSSTLWMERLYIRHNFASIVINKFT